MRLAIILIVVFGVAGALVWVFSTRAAQQTPITNTSFERVQQDISNGAKFYDVRTKEEYADGHFKNAVNWPVEAMQAGQLPDVRKDTKIYVYCHSGNRASKATTALQQAGFSNVTSLGGLTDVQRMGGALIK